MFHKADLVLITKMDLVPYLDIDVDLIEENIARVMPRPEVLRVSAKTGEGIDRWVAWLEARRAALAPAPHEHAGGHRHFHHHHHG